MVSISLRLDRRRRLLLLADYGYAIRFRLFQDLRGSFDHQVEPVELRQHQYRDAHLASSRQRHHRRNVVHIDAFSVHVHDVGEHDDATQEEDDEHGEAVVDVEFC